MILFNCERTPQLFASPFSKHIRYLGFIMEKEEHFVGSVA